MTAVYVRRWKPCLDRLEAVLLLLVMAPVLLLITLIVRMNLGPGVFFRSSGSAGPASRSTSSSSGPCSRPGAGRMCRSRFPTAGARTSPAPTPGIRPSAVDTVFHLASLASPRDYLRFPIETLRAGSLGTGSCLELARV